MTYDSELQMFVEPPALLDYVRLEFLRWLYEHGHYADDSEPYSNVWANTELNQGT